MKNILKYLTFLLIIMVIVGCENSDIKTYNANGLNITMLKGLTKKDYGNATLYYENNDIFFMALKEDFETLEQIDINKDSTIEEYADEVFISHDKTYDLINDDGLTYFTYEYTASNGTYYYFNSLHKSDDAFWVCTFACLSTNKDTYHDLFITWSKSITFS